MAYITCEDLALGYEGKAVTEHIHFTVNKGDYLCIIGENGAGKSTLMKTLLHLYSLFPEQSKPATDCQPMKWAICRSRRQYRKIFRISYGNRTDRNIKQERLEAVLQQTAEK